MLFRSILVTPRIRLSSCVVSRLRFSSRVGSGNCQWSARGWAWTRQSHRLSNSGHHLTHHKFSYSLSTPTLRSLSTSSHKLASLSPNCRSKSGGSDQHQKGKSVLEQRHKTVLYYLCAVAVLVAGASYAAVPLYRIFCQVSPSTPRAAFVQRVRVFIIQVIVVYLEFRQSYSYGGTVATHSPDKDISKMKKVKNRELTIKFNADKSSSLQWSFVPRQNEIIVRLSTK